MRRLGAMVATTAVLVVGGAAPAGAELTTDEVGCAGSALITGEDGSTVTVDAGDSSAVIPASGSAAWTGSVATVTHDHRGSISVAIGPASIELASWTSPNAGSEPSRTGTKELPSALGDLPPGRYEVTGSHDGDEGRCAGRMTVEVDASMLSSPISAASGLLGAGGLLLLLLGLLRGLPTTAGLGGLLAGLFGGLDLLFLKVVGSGSPLLVVLPPLLLVLAVALGVARMRQRSGR